jgi:hypothetical protein
VWEPAGHNLAIGLRRNGKDIIVRIGVKAVDRLGVAGRRQTNQQRDEQSVKRGDQ